MYTENNQTQTERVLGEIRSGLLAGRWLAGTRLREVPLAETFGISRTPLRSALQQLEQEGLLQRLSSGYTVRSFSLQDALMAIELRGVLEGTAARLAAQRRLDETELYEIQRLCDEMEQLVLIQSETHWIDQYGELNTLFHEKLAALSGSDLIVQEVHRACRWPFAAPSAFTTSRSDIERFRTSLVVGQEQHKSIVQAIARWDGSRAEALAREHAHLAKANVEVAVQARTDGQTDLPQLALVTG